MLNSFISFLYGVYLVFKFLIYLMKIFKIVLFASALILLLISITGLFKSMRNPDIYTEEDTGRLNDITIRYEDTFKEIERKENESDKAFALRMNEVVNRSMSHYFKEKGKEKYNLRVPIWENYMLFAINATKEDNRYEFRNYKKGFERGVGLCSSHSIVLRGILRDNGIKADLWDLTRHVVVRAKVSENEWYILDPDYGICVPHDMDEINADPEITRASYANMASQYKPEYDDPYTTDIIVDIYGIEGKRIYDYDSRLENFSYVAIWILPLLLMLPFGLGIMLKKG